jgi:hypothetical protein
MTVIDTHSLRAELLAQHQSLVVRLQELRRIARAVLAGESGVHQDLLTKLAAILSALEAHMAFEENHLAGVLHNGTPGGVRYVTVLHEDHAAQRETLARLGGQADECDDVLALARDVEAFVADVLLDIEEEDLKFITPELLEATPPDTLHPRS